MAAEAGKNVLVIQQETFHQGVCHTHEFKNCRPQIQYVVLGTLAGERDRYVFSGGFGKRLPCQLKGN